MMIGMSQEKLGDALGITFQQIQKYEKGANRIGASRMHQICAVLGVPVEFFYQDAPDLQGARPEGFAEMPPADYMADFLSTAEGVALMKAFSRIRDARVRKRLVDLVQALAGDEDTAQTGNP
jgi:transcriptional regulator with XRE-family HTH domain